MIADQTKENVRIRVAILSLADFEAFIANLDAAMRRSGLNLRSYLIPLGISARHPSELTPNEIGHLARFFCLTDDWQALAPFAEAFIASTGHTPTSPLAEGSGNGLPRRGRRAARPHIRRIAAAR